MNARPGVPTRPLLVLLAVVLLVHWVALEGAPATTTAWKQLRTEALTIRTITPVPAPAKPAPRATFARRSSAPAGSTPTAPPPVALPGSAHWHYTATALHRGALLTGRAELAWQHDGRRYEATLRTDIPPLPARLQRSAGELDAQGLAPRRFSERSRTEEAAHFDRDQGRIVFSGQHPAAPLRASAQDRLSVLLQLGALLAARPQGWSPGDEVIVQTATAREAADWRFVVDGMETLALPTGPTAALKLARAPRHEYDARLELWFVPGAAYGPVRLRLTPANGDWLDLLWSGTDKG
jgi:hypothetical protein